MHSNGPMFPSNAPRGWLAEPGDDGGRPRRARTETWDQNDNAASASDSAVSTNTVV